MKKMVTTYTVIGADGIPVDIFVGELSSSKEHEYSVRLKRLGMYMQVSHSRPRPSDQIGMLLKNLETEAAKAKEVAS